MEYVKKQNLFYVKISFPCLIAWIRKGQITNLPKQYNVFFIIAIQYGYNHSHKYLPWQNKCLLYNSHSFCIDKSFFLPATYGQFILFYVVSFSIAPKSHFNIDNWIAVNSPSGVPDWVLTTSDLRLIFFIYTTWSFYSLSHV